MKTKLIFSLYMCVMLASCREVEVFYLSDLQPDADYLSNWTGAYEGVSNHWRAAPSQNDTGWTFLETHEDKAVLVTVQQGTLDSCLTLTITYNQSKVVTNENLKISFLGTHYSSWGGGSGAGHLSVTFTDDSLHYHYFQKCGIPCSSGIDFSIRKN